MVEVLPRLGITVVTTDEGLRGRNVMHSLRVHSCASMLNNICSESMSAARMSLYFKVAVRCTVVEVLPRLP